MVDVKITSYGMWRYGNDFRKAVLAVRVRHNDRPFMPYYFLLGQSIELSLKPFLMLYRLRGHDRLPKVVPGVNFNDGIEVVGPQARTAAARPRPPPGFGDSAYTQSKGE